MSLVLTRPGSGSLQMTSRVVGPAGACGDGADGQGGGRPADGREETATVEADLSPGIGGGDSGNVRMRLQQIDGKWRPCGEQFGFVDIPLTSRSA